MASPTVCGLSALLLQDFRAQFPSQPDFRNSTLTPAGRLRLSEGGEYQNQGRDSGLGRRQRRMNMTRWNKLIILAAVFLALVGVTQVRADHHERKD